MNNDSRQSPAGAGGGPDLQGSLLRALMRSPKREGMAKTMAQMNDAPRNALKLPAAWAGRLIFGSLALTAIAITGSAWQGAGWSIGAMLAWGVAAIAWGFTLMRLRRWRAEDCTAFRLLVEHTDRLNGQIASQSAEIERRGVALRETNARVASLEDAIRVYEPEAQRLRASTARALEAERKARDGERAKAEYLARMSGDIRAPLTTILGFTQTLVDMGDVSKAPPDRLEAIFVIKQEGQRLLDTIDDTLELCAIELQQSRVNPVRCSLVEVVDEVHRLLVGWAEARGLGLLVEYVGRVPEFITTDPERLTQVLINVLGNAIKFTLSGDVRLKIGLAQDAPANPQLWFEVLDSGIGMHKEDSGRLFGGFAHAADRRRRGSGLGLTISKSYAEMLGGDIVLTDTMPGIGTRIRFSIRIGDIVEDELISPPAPSPLAVKPLPEPRQPVPAARVARQAEPALSA